MSATPPQTPTLLHRFAGACALACAAILALLVRSAWTHAELLAYGIGFSTAWMAPLLTAIALLAAACARAGARLWKRPPARAWHAWAIFPLCTVPAAFACLLIHAVEVTYERGDINLARVAAHAQDLPRWNARAQTVRAGILHGAGLSPLPKRTPLNPVLHDRRVQNGYSVENVRIESIPGFFLAANLYRPEPPREDTATPVVLLPHGHFPEGRFDPAIQHLGASFARMGALAFACDMVGRGESGQVPHNSPHALTMQLWNSMRAIDFVLSLPGADPARVGMTGASGGGTQTFLCTAVDSRVTAAAPVAMVSSWCYGGCACEIGLPIHRGPAYATNNAEIAALTAPRPLLVVSDGADWTRTVPRLEYPYLRGVYTLFGCPQNVENAHFPDGVHDYGPEKRRAVCLFFAKRFGLNADALNEDSDTILPRNALEFFDAAHPMPASALHGWDAVIRQLHTLQSER